jgi:hypothetical protein
MLPKGVNQDAQPDVISPKPVSGQGPDCGYADIVNGWLSFD